MRLIECDVVVNNDSVDGIENTELRTAIIDFDEVHFAYTLIDSNYTMLCNALGDPIFSVHLKLNTIKQLLPQPIVKIGYDNYAKN
ncbi:MAG TPA: hypothetical protein PLC04_07985 [Candidatus Kapabacteria bacterium]|nr:hypothetical protein [Candidatus Kapabacteria bacterium]